MSAALIESPTHASSQLFFVWPEPEIASVAESAELLPPIPPRPVEPSQAAPTIEITKATSTTAGLTLAARGGGEVRIGAVMIKLLKRYGITDAEIEEGLNNYAKKTCHSAAC